MNHNKLLLAVALGLATCGAQAQTLADVALLESRVDRGEQRAMVELARHYLAMGKDGIARVYLEQAVEAGGDLTAQAHAELAAIFAKQGGGRIFQERKEDHLKRAAVLGDVPSQILYAVILLDRAKEGDGSVHTSIAVRLLEHANKSSGSPEAAFQLGRAYLLGQGLPVKVGVGQSWLVKAAQAKHPEAAYLLGDYAAKRGYTEDARGFLEMAVQNGSGQAAMDLATYWWNGVIGLNRTTAEGWAEKASQAGVFGADEFLAKLRSGAAPESIATKAQAIVVQPPEEALENEDRPAERQVEPANEVREVHVDDPVPLAEFKRQHERLLDQPIAKVPDSAEVDSKPVAEVASSQAGFFKRFVDRVQGLRYRGDTDGVVAHEAKPAKVKLTHNERGMVAHAAGDYRKAARLFNRGARRGDAEAINNLATLHLQGLGVEVDPVKSMALYRQAVSLGHSGAAANVAYMYEHGVGVHQDVARARNWQAISDQLHRKAEAAPRLASAQ